MWITINTDKRKNLNKLRNMYSWTKRLNMFIILTLPNLIYTFNSVPTHHFFIDIDRVILKCIWKCKRSSIAHTILKKNKVEGITISDLRITIKVY